mmetsp:Transcript_39446/g.43623  ORF Transcript_39446/g.43623 Transcript_39446/m.43623 type:complete len:249 (+) Transcript_39446:66-812(+)
MSEVKVVAPSDLNEGYEFDAKVDGKVIKVVVPEGGVKEGEEFMVPFAAIGSTGPREFKHSLCSCCETCPCPCLWAFCCYFDVIFLGQILQRMKLNFLGQPTSEQPTSEQPSGKRNTCTIFLLIWIVIFTIQGIAGATTTRIDAEGDADDGSIVYNLPGFYILSATNVIISTFLTVAATLARNHLRKKKNIEGICCKGDGCLDDCCCVYWCPLCTYIQMHRETAGNEKFDLTTQTGLRGNRMMVDENIV